MRAFVAIEVDDPLEPATTDGRPRAPSHLTLRFLGEVPEERAGPIGVALRSAVAMSPPFTLTLEGVGAFPSRNAPRVVWVGVTQGREHATELSRKVSESLARVGFPPEAAGFVPHVTLFRVRSPRDRHRARLLLDGTEPPPGARTVRVAEIVLKESTLTPGGALHRALGRFPLLGAPTPEA